MNRCVILSAGPVCDPVALAGYLLPDDYIIAADGGWQLALQMGVTPAEPSYVTLRCGMRSLAHRERCYGYR